MIAYKAADRNATYHLFINNATLCVTSSPSLPPNLIVGIEAESICQTKYDDRRAVIRGIAEHRRCLIFADERALRHLNFYA